MKLAFELAPAQADRLRAEAERLGVHPAEFARAVLMDQLAASDEEFQMVAARVVAKNRELYRRLA